MSKIKAALTHFLASLIVFSLVLLVVRYFWYPAPFFVASGAWQGLQLIAGVDVILGPLLTFVIFNSLKSKKELMTDVSIIILFQMIALVWGVHTVYQQRPVAVAFFGGSFVSIPARAFADQNISTDKLTPFGNSFPVITYIKEPKTEEEVKEVAKYAKQGIPPLHQLDLYRPLTDYIAEMKALELPNTYKKIKNTPKMKAELDLILAKSNTVAEDYHYFWVYTDQTPLILLIDHEGKPQGYITVTKN